MSFGKTNGQSQSSNSFQNSTTLGTGVWDAQSPYLQDMYSRAQGQANQGFAGQGSMNAAGGYFGQAGGALGQSNQALGGAFNGYSNMANNQQVDPMLQQYGQALGRNWTQNILPGMQGQAAMAGGLGNSRDQIGQALAAGQQGQQFQDFAGQLYGQQQDRRMQALSGMGQVGSAYGQNAAGYGALGGDMTQFGNAQQAAAWNPLQQYAGLLGGPTQLNKGGYSSGVSAGSGSGGGGWNFSAGQ